MIITRTPLRVSFLGGGSDYRDFFEKEPGFVLGSTITKYVYVFSHPLPTIAPEKFRFTYRVTESVQSYNEFSHPVMKSTLRLLNWEKPTNFATMSDLPGSSGLGGSSSFTVGLLKALFSQNEMIKSADEIARLAIHIERELIGEAGGFQDQFHASCGGFNLYRFDKVGVEVKPLRLSRRVLDFISDAMILIPLSGERDSSVYAKKTMKSINENSGFEIVRKMSHLARQVAEAMSTESSPVRALNILAEGVNRGWGYKSSISGDSANTSSAIDEIKRCGALAAKLCGAGGTGFILALVQPDDMNLFIEETKRLNPIKVGLEPKGSAIILSE